MILYQVLIKLFSHLSVLPLNNWQFLDHLESVENLLCSSRDSDSCILQQIQATQAVVFPLAYDGLKKKKKSFAMIRSGENTHLEYYDLFLKHFEV